MTLPDFVGKMISTFKNMLIMTVLISLDNNIMAVTTIAPPSPCLVTNDVMYQGVAVDCRRRNVSSLPLPDHWLPDGTTTLLLGFNAIGHLENDSFSSLKTPTALRCLDLGHNQISEIDALAFSTLTGLQKLYLSNNQINLDQSYLSGNVFRGLGNVSTLELGDNQVKHASGEYPPSLLEDLHSLEVLSLDTFWGVLQFGTLFNNTKKLISLRLTGSVTRISNDTFKVFEDIKVRELNINANYLEFVEVGALRYFNYLDAYILSGTSQNIENILEGLSPFVNRTLSEINISYVGNLYRISKKIIQNGIITHHMARYLVQICVNKFSLVKSMVFVVEEGVITGPLWRKCLKNIDISGNPLSGEIIEVLRIGLMSNLEYFKMSGGKYTWTYGAESFEWHPPVCMSNVTGQSKRLRQISKGNVSKITRLPAGNISHTRNVIAGPTVAPNVNASQRTTSNAQTTPLSVHNQIIEDDFIKFYLPKTLKFLMVNSQDHYLFSLDQNYLLIGAENVEEVHLADNGLTAFTGTIRGLVNLKVLDISRNNASEMSIHFFDHVSSVRKLNMAYLKLQQSFMGYFSNKLFKNLTELQCLDLSYNDIEYLAKDTFAVNTKLRLLLLAGNRLQSIPFSLSDTPNLCLLDLRTNSFRLMSMEDTDDLENHARSTKSFSLRLEGNNIFCGCSSIRFLAWLKRTRINLDNDGNYSCLSDSGIRIHTGDIEDLEAMWRLCHGQKAFWLSLVIMSMMFLCFICCIVLTQFKTQFRLLVFKMLWTPFLTKTSDDYPIGVFIGYADEDWKLACQHLRQYIELKLRLTTYVKHRDLLPASEMGEAIAEAVYSSWRVLLVVSPQFLNDPWAYFLLKVSTYSVQAENPGRIVLVLTDDNDHDSMLSKLPNCILKAVQEENIITMTRQGNISYEDKQALKSALLNRFC